MTLNAYDVLKERGFVQQVTDESAVRSLLGQGPVTIYTGYDPTAASLHVGHLFSLMALKHLQRCGHRAIALVGGGTAMVGDPSGKSELRQMLSQEQVEANLAAVSQQLCRLLGGDEPAHEHDGLEDSPTGGREAALIVNNAAWLCNLKYIDFLRDIGRHFSVNRMLAAEAYKARLERGLSFIEFNYQLLQAYDFLELRRRYECRVQMGGDDQWSNILAGVDLCRRLDQNLVHGITTPLLLTASGQKMGKTASGAVWLDAARLSPYDYYQYWVNTHDADVTRMLGYFTFLPMGEIEACKGLAGEELNAAKSILAYEATALVHGTSAAGEAHLAALGAFGGRRLPEVILPSSQVPRNVASHADASHIPATSVTLAKLAAGWAVVDVLVSTALASSKSQARRLIEQGAVKVGENKISDPGAQLQSSDFSGVGTVVLVRVGKKRVHGLRLTG